MRRGLGLLVGLGIFLLALIIFSPWNGDNEEGGGAESGAEDGAEGDLANACDFDLTGDGVVDDEDIDAFIPVLQTSATGNQRYNFFPGPVIDGQDLIEMLPYLYSTCSSPIAGPATAVGTGPTPFPSCIRVLPALDDKPLTLSAFQAADEGLVTTIELASLGDVAAAETAFFGAAHDLTHNVDGSLRQVDEGLAIQLCNEVVIMERELVNNRDSSIVEEQAQKIREIVKTVAVALGLNP